MSTKKSSKTSLKNSDHTNFSLAVILAKICKDLNQEALQKFIEYCSAYLEDQDFQKVFKISRTFLKNRSKNGICCDDWLVENLYFFYNDSAVFF